MPVHELYNLQSPSHKELLRRDMVQHWCDAENDINEAMQTVESMGADPRLTEALHLLLKARNIVSDYWDEKELGFVEYDHTETQVSMSQYAQFAKTDVNSNIGFGFDEKKFIESVESFISYFAKSKDHYLVSAIEDHLGRKANIEDLKKCSIVKPAQELGVSQNLDLLYYNGEYLGRLVQQVDTKTGLPTFRFYNFKP